LVKIEARKRELGHFNGIFEQTWRNAAKRSLLQTPLLTALTLVSWFDAKAGR
jgi:hypothetical protein